MLHLLTLIAAAAPLSLPSSGRLVIANPFPAASSEMNAEAQAELWADAALLATFREAAQITVLIREGADEADHPGLGGERSKVVRAALVKAGLPDAQLSAAALLPDPKEPDLALRVVLRPERVGYRLLAHPGNPTTYEVTGPLNVGDRVVATPVVGTASPGSIRVELEGGGSIQFQRPTGAAVVGVQYLPTRAVALELVAGRVELEAHKGADGIRIGTPTAAIAISDARVRVARSETRLELTVEQGEASVTTQSGTVKVPAGQGAAVDVEGHLSLFALPAAPIALAPLLGATNQAQFSVGGEGAGPLRVEVAGDPDFDAPLGFADVTGGAAKLPLQPGRYYWRAERGEGSRSQRSAVYAFTLTPPPPSPSPPATPTR